VSVEPRNRPRRLSERAEMVRDACSERSCHCLRRRFAIAKPASSPLCAAEPCPSGNRVYHVRHPPSRSRAAVVECNTTSVLDGWPAASSTASSPSPRTQQILPSGCGEGCHACFCFFHATTFRPCIHAYVGGTHRRCEKNPLMDPWPRRRLNPTDRLVSHYCRCGFHWIGRSLITNLGSRSVSRPVSLSLEGGGRSLR